MFIVSETISFQVGNVPDWSHIEIAASSSRLRRGQDILPILSDILLLWDFTLCAVSGYAALQLYAGYILFHALDFSASGPFWRDIVFGSVIAALVLRTRSSAFNPRFLSVPRLVLAAERRCLLACAVLMGVGLLTRSTHDLARLWLLSWLLLFAVLVAATRFVLGSYLSGLGRTGGLREAVAVIGAAGVRERMAARIADEADVIGVFGPDMGDGSSDDCPDEFERLLEMGRDGDLDSVILATDDQHGGEVAQIIARLKSMPVQVVVCPESGWAACAESETRLLGGVAMTVVADRPIKHWNLWIKTLIDKAGAALLLVLLAPLLLAVALGIAATSEGPVIYRQTRRGWSGRNFVIFKFRTMVAGSETLGRQTRRGDARCTKVGLALRRCSLDELPQLWNVLRGEMSLVGPRPHAEALHDIDRAGREIVAEYAQRHRVKPGLTGWAQVNGARGATTSIAQMQRRVMFDLYYIENWSFWLDLKILALTPFRMVGKNAF